MAQVFANSLSAPGFSATTSNGASVGIQTISEEITLSTSAAVARLDSNGLTLKDCTLVASGASATQTVTTGGSAQNLVVHGTCMVNKPLNANVTPTIGSLVEDSSLT